MEIVRWLLAVGLAVLWLGIAAVNANIFFASRPGAPPASMVPLGAGVVALLAVAVCPIESAQKWWFFLAALVLDVGSLPYLVLAAVVLAREGVSEAGGLKGWVLRWWAGRSWSFKLMMGTIGGVVVLVLTLVVWTFFELIAKEALGLFRRG